MRRLRVQNAVVQGLTSIVQQMNAGTYTKSSAAVLITRDAATNILTFVYAGVDAADGMKLFAEAAAIRGFVPQKEDSNGDSASTRKRRVSKANSGQ